MTKLVQLRHVLEVAGHPERISNPQDEKFVTVRLHCQGAVERQIKAGKTPVPFTGYRISSGQFIYSRIDARHGAFAVVPPELDGAVVSKDFPIFNIRKEYIAPAYLLHYLRAGQLQAQIRASSFGATNRQRISEDVLGDFRIPLPNLTEQRRVIAILDHADALGAKRRLVLKHLESLTQAIFHEMFADLEGEEIALREAIKWRSGRFLPAKDQAGGPYPVYGGNGINGTHDAYLFREPRLIVGRVGANCGAVHITLPNAWVTDNALIGELLRRDLRIEYLLFALREANLNQYAAVSGQPSISASRIGEARILVPPSALQSRFAHRLALMRKRVEQVERASRMDAELFASLQARAFRGEL